MTHHERRDPVHNNAATLINSGDVTLPTSDSRFRRYRATLLTEWANASGPEAARIRWMGVRFQLGCILFFGIALIAGGLASHSTGEAGSVLWWLCLGLFVVSWAAALCMFYNLRSWKKAARQWRSGRVGS
jgi:hypothetical protein